MASVDMAPLCTVCLVHHWPDSRHFGPVRRWWHRRVLRRR